MDLYIGPMETIKRAHGPNASPPWAQCTDVTVLKINLPLFAFRRYCIETKGQVVIRRSLYPYSASWQRSWYRSSYCFPGF